MPELPEVETIRRDLEPALAGLRIVSVTVARRDLRRPVPESLEAAVTGAVITGVRRRGKLLLIVLGDDAPLLAIHLGMTGRLILQPGDDRTAPAEIRPAHDHVVFRLSDGSRLIFNDARRFGLVDLAPGGRHPLIDALGPEPLGEDFSPSLLAASLSRKGAPVKTVIMDGAVVAGVGNIYACETLWRAGIDPRRPARDLTVPEVGRVFARLREVLGDAISRRGSSLRDYRDASGAPGGFQETFAVYGRDGLACRRAGCGGTVMRIVQGGRSTFLCPACQV